MKILALIPARGGSKEVPFKNLQILNGKPLIAHTIENAKKSKKIERVIVSTDDDSIAYISKKYSAEVIKRPKSISKDKSSSELALLHALKHLNRNEKYFPDIVVFLQCTSPLTLPQDIDGTIDTLINEKADCALSVSTFHHFLWKKNSRGNLIGINHDKNNRVLRQNMDPQFIETGAVYVMRTKGFKEAKHRFFGKTEMYIVPPERCLEIDNPIDLRVAEAIMHEQEQEKILDLLPNSISALVLDFDGVLTDNKVLVLEDGSEAVLCNRSDGLGLAQTKILNIPVLVLSTEKNPVVKARCEKLGLECVYGIQDKSSALKKWLEKASLDISNVIYVGNDTNDLLCLNAVGCGVAVNDSHEKVKKAAKVILDSNGGEGAVREITDLIEKKSLRT